MIFKGKEGKTITEQIRQTEKKFSAKLDKLPDILKEDGYPDGQALMRTFRETESVVEQYNCDLAEWECQISRKPTADNFLMINSLQYDTIDLQPNIYKNGSEIIHENFDIKWFSTNKW